MERIIHVANKKKIKYAIVVAFLHCFFSCSKYTYCYDMRINYLEHELHSIPCKSSFICDDVYIYEIEKLRNKKHKDEIYIIYCYVNNKASVLLSKNETYSMKSEKEQLEKGKCYRLPLNTDKRHAHVLGETKIMYFESFALSFKKTDFSFHDIYVSENIKGLYILSTE
ncbi:MAG: hypothetical protein IJ916_13135 [Paludibacteraceae bacterium]|nr:hypothetical protein [Paludibacteraceae bacterium]